MSLQIKPEDRPDYVRKVLEKRGIRFVNKELEKTLGESKGNVSQYMSGTKLMSENFWKRFIEHYCGDVESEDNPNTMINIDDYINALKKQVAMADLMILELKSDKDWLKRMMEAEVSAMKSNLSQIQDDQLMSISLIKGAVDTQSEYAAKVLNQPVDSVALKTGKASLGHVEKLRQRDKVGSSS